MCGNVRRRDRCRRHFDRGSDIRPLEVLGRRRRGPLRLNDARFGRERKIRAAIRPDRFHRLIEKLVDLAIPVVAYAEALVDREHDELLLCRMKPIQARQCQHNEHDNRRSQH